MNATNNGGGLAYVPTRGRRIEIVGVGMRHVEVQTVEAESDVIVDLGTLSPYGIDARGDHAIVIRRLNRSDLSDLPGESNSDSRTDRKRARTGLVIGSHRSEAIFDTREETEEGKPIRLTVPAGAVVVINEYPTRVMMGPRGFDGTIEGEISQVSPELTARIRPRSHPSRDAPADTPVPKRRLGRTLFGGLRSKRDEMVTSLDDEALNDLETQVDGLASRPLVGELGLALDETRRQGEARWKKTPWQERLERGLETMSHFGATEEELARFTRFMEEHPDADEDRVLNAAIDGGHDPGPSGGPDLGPPRPTTTPPLDSGPQGAGRLPEIEEEHVIPGSEEAAVVPETEEGQSARYRGTNVVSSRDADEIVRWGPPLVDEMRTTTDEKRTATIDNSLSRRRPHSAVRQHVSSPPRGDVPVPKSVSRAKNRRPLMLTPPQDLSDGKAKLLPGDANVSLLCKWDSDTAIAEGPEAEPTSAQLGESLGLDRSIGN